ncbi:MAG: hypothetical protein OXH96_05535 [Spirochaetaceae bacterium]|nr:hypothetical protein [Spirochaetaceae bacterium]
MSGDTLAVLGVGVTLLAAILTFGFALLGAHRTTRATVNARMDRMDQRMDRMETALNDLRRDVTDIDRRLSRIEGAVLGPWRPEPPTEPLPERDARQEPVPAAGTGSPRQ